MRYRALGDSGFTISEVGFGTWELGGQEWGSISEDVAIGLLHYAFDQGVNFYDTADQYGAGRSEELLGKAFQGRSESVVIATKVGYRLGTDGWISRGDKPQRHNLSRDYIFQSCEGSLRRLRRERIDIYQMHRPPEPDEWDEAVAAMEDLKRQGKIAQYGMSLTSEMDVGKRAIEETDAATLMLIFNCLDQAAANEVLPLALERGVGVLARVPLASGLLTGTLTPETKFVENDYRKVWPREQLLDDLEKVEKLKFVGEGEADSLAEGSLRFVLAHQGITSVVAGMMSEHEVDENVKASGKTLSDEVVERVRNLYRSGFA